jgi:hypothetical protein
MPPSTFGEVLPPSNSGVASTAMYTDIPEKARKSKRDNHIANLRATVQVVLYDLETAAEPSTPPYTAPDPLDWDVVERNTSSVTPPQSYPTSVPRAPFGRKVKNAVKPRTGHDKVEVPTDREEERMRNNSPRDVGCSTKSTVHEISFRQVDDVDDGVKFRRKPQALTCEHCKQACEDSILMCDDHMYCSGSCCTLAKYELAAKKSAKARGGARGLTRRASQQSMAAMLGSVCEDQAQ